MPPEGNTDARMREVLAMVAPGTPLRDGLERILRGRTGALVVLGLDRSVESITRGGFALDVDFTATRLRELAKMDGACLLRVAASGIHSSSAPSACRSSRPWQSSVPSAATRTGMRSA